MLSFPTYNRIILWMMLVLLRRLFPMNGLIQRQSLTHFIFFKSACHWVFSMMGAICKGTMRWGGCMIQTTWWYVFPSCWLLISSFVSFLSLLSTGSSAACFCAILRTSRHNFVMEFPDVSRSLELIASRKACVAEERFWNPLSDAVPYSLGLCANSQWVIAWLLHWIVAKDPYQ